MPVTLKPSGLVFRRLQSWLRNEKTGWIELRVVDGPKVMVTLIDHPTLSVVFISKNENICACQIQGLLLSWVNTTTFCFCFAHFLVDR